MATNNNDSRPSRSYGNANNERHSSSNRNYNVERRPQREDGNYRPSYEENYNRNYESNPNSPEGSRKRRPRVGERVSSGAHGGGGERNYNAYGNAPGRPRNAQPVNQGPKKLVRKKKIFKQIKYKENADPTAPIRLNKYLANAGVCSRREADEFIQAGVVKVNGEVVTELGTKITRADEVMFNDQVVSLESKVYVLLNKPKGFVTTTDDPENRKTVMDLVKAACKERIYPVGRLDRATTGVLLLTNDGNLAHRIISPKHGVWKTYYCEHDGEATAADVEAFAKGLLLPDGLSCLPAVLLPLGFGRSAVRLQELRALRPENAPRPQRRPGREQLARLRAIDANNAVGHGSQKSPRGVLGWATTTASRQVSIGHESAIGG